MQLKGKVPGQQNSFIKLQILMCFYCGKIKITSVLQNFFGQGESILDTVICLLRRDVVHILLWQDSASLLETVKYIAVLFHRI